MRRAMPCVVLGLGVVLAGWAFVHAKESGTPSPSAALTEAESGAAKKDADAKPATDAAAAYKAREEAARLARETARVNRTLGARMTRRPSIDFERTSVKEVLTYLAEVGKFSVVFDEALEQAGIDLSTRTVSLRISGVTYEKVLELVLPRECGYRVEAGYVLITTLEKSYMPLRTRTYSIRLTLAQVPDFTDAPRFNIGDVTQAAASAAGGGGFGELFGGSTTTTNEAEQVTPDRVIELVKKFVTNQNDRRIAPWDDEGGPATINYLGGQLIVSQTDHGHQAVAKLLAMIE